MIEKGNGVSIKVVHYEHNALVRLESELGNELEGTVSVGELLDVG